MTDQLLGAPRMAMEILTLPDLPLASLRFEQVAVADLQRIFDSAFAAIAGAIGSGSIQAVLPGVGIYYGDPSQVFDLEVGAVLAQPMADPVVAGDHTVTPSELPAGEYAALSHVGPYDGLGDSWNALMGQVVAEGRVPAFPFFEAYVNDPRTTPPAELRTDLMVRLAPAG